MSQLKKNDICVIIDCQYFDDVFGPRKDIGFVFRCDELEKIGEL